MKKRAANFIDMRGLSFGHLKAIELSHIKNKQSFWKCVCSCGNFKITSGSNLRKGRTKSCGCLKHRKVPAGFSSLNRIYKQYQRGAKTRNHSFSLSIDDFKNITQQICHYCGSPPMKAKTNNCNDITIEAIEYGKYIYNGIDRIDNTKGYDLENSVPCCSICNRAKSDLPYKVFVDYIKRIKYQGNED